jgi:hypothetical protein
MTLLDPAYCGPVAQGGFAMAGSSVPLWKRNHDDKPVVDLHMHPAPNRLVLKQNLGLRYVVSRSFNPLAVRLWGQCVARAARRLGQEELN